MTPERIAEILAVADAATPGPWQTSEACCRAIWPAEGPPVVFSDAGVREPQNVAFIAMARTAR